MNVELVSKTVPNKTYFDRKLQRLVGKSQITDQEYQEAINNLDAEQLMIYIARVSSSRDNKLEDYDKLLNFLIDNGHFSPFEHAYMTVEIETSRAIGRQLLRHRSFTFQEFSQRYSSDIEFENFELRAQPEENRQSSSERWATIMHDGYDTDEFTYRYPQGGIMGDPGQPFRALSKTSDVLDELQEAYEELIESGVASETARMILPECTRTTIYMTGNCRSWLHLLDLRDDEASQKEIRKVANEIGKVFQEEFPVTSEAMGFNYL